MATDNEMMTTKTVEELGEKATDNEMIITKTVVELDEKTTPVDADLFIAGDAGAAALKKFKWSNLLAAIKTKLAAWTFNTLTTSNKTLPGAVNELNSKIPVFKRAKGTTEEITIPANNTVNASGTINIPDGYEIFAVYPGWSEKGDCIAKGITINDTGVLIPLRNLLDTEIVASYVFHIIFIKK